ncbi:BN860_08130g1_1 [Zygosaccharomyces bailii CLIB 213]|uniref:E3 ubiquitin-protein ligase n=1 Tax=Zygosaccharomyces bailii (strain CLIB 213 / ATCC 58445 / CBS 680 / BCRC 21525 / NBRC 1098 / NCYC 1416 / NRRL Y-2227) TaxID=1333698 RepID=A0A8J2WWS1_ZYGB2|nr:BN860_08130g1_1 [Zygosaccharomyces bailii CLIB 213]
MNYGVTNIRDFLVHLPKLAKYNYNDAVSYLVFKVLDLLMRCPPGSVDWSSIVTILESERWHDGTYKRILQDIDWKLTITPASKNASHKDAMCSKQCYPTETVFYCFTCTTNPLYEICESCFDEEKHRGHLYTAKVVVRPEGRVCHCGDPFVFKEPRFAFLCKNEQNNGPRTGPQGYNESALSTIGDVLDYLIDVMIYFKEVKENAQPMEVARQENTNSPVQQDLTLLRDSYGQVDDLNEQDTVWALQIDEEDCQMHYMDLTAKIARILNKPTEYAITITNMLEDGASSVTILRSKDKSKLRKISLQFQNEGAKNHIRSIGDTFKRDLTEDLIEWLYNIFSDESVSLETRASLRLCMLDKWHSGLLSTKLTSNRLSCFTSKINLLGGFLVSYEQRDTFPWFEPWKFTFNAKDDRLQGIMADYNKRLRDTDIPNSVNRFHGLHGSRFQYLLTEFPNFLSRLSRHRLVRVFCMLFTITDEARQYLAAQYLDVYLALLYGTVASDSTGFKVSMMGILSQYTFQDPETTNLAIRSGFVQRALRFAFTLMAFNPEDLVAYLPIPLYYGCKLPNETIRNRRTIICFKDICVLMSTNTVAQELLEDEGILSAIIESFAEFNNILPLKRETSEHVEFENFDFSSYYFFFSSILIMTDGYVRGISLIMNPETRRKVVTRLINIAMEKEFDSLGRFRKELPSCTSPKGLLDPKISTSTLLKVQETICGHKTEVINFQVGVDTQNFFNPMSYLFKFILQWSQCGRYAPLPEGLKNYINFENLFCDKKKALYISEASLSTLVLLGQINVGFWVRNGTPITHQARMYTRYSMREFTYMSDIFNVQFSMVLADPSDFVVTFLSRWGLRNWANGFPMGDFPDAETTTAIVNQCFLLLIQLFTEIKSLSMVSSVDGFEKTLKAEIIHALCFKNCTYSQIMNFIPEHITKHAAFDLYLEKYANYTPPSGLMDCGIYTLKPEYREEVDPFYFGLSASKRYEAEKSIRSSMAIKNQINFDDTFIPAKKVINYLKNSPYSKLFAISSTETFGLFLKNSLDHINKFDFENLLPNVVYLIHLCVINNLNDFMKIFWHEYTSMDSAECFYHSIGSILYGFLLKDNFSNVHGTIREIFRYLSETAPHVNAGGYLQEQAHSFNPDILRSSNIVKSSKDEEFERKKKMARMKKEKVIRRLERQQMKFIENNSIPTTDEEEFKESSMDSVSGDIVGWEFPHDSCVFCKMPGEDDVFVYFSYQESNICDHNIDFTRIKETANTLLYFSTDSEDKKNKQKSFSDSENYGLSPQMRLTIQDAVMKTCGHGSHISCLGNHMKSIRAAHNQTTKNVPVAYGFGLLYCPLCNGLCNSFLPKLTNTSSRAASDFFENKFQAKAAEESSLLLSTSMKAARICEDLTGKANSQKIQPFEIINRIFVNTVLNTELSSRCCPASVAIHEMPNQRLLTLRLLSELKSFLYLNYTRNSDFIVNQEVGPQNLFMLQEKYPDLLLLASEAMEHPLYTTLNQLPTLSAPTFYLKELIKTKLFKDCITLSKELVRVQFYKEHPVRSPWSIAIDPNESSSHEAVLIAEIIKKHLLCLDPVIPDDILRKVECLKFHIHIFLAESLKIFLRRLCMIFHSIYAIELEYSKEETFLRETDFLLSYLRMPSFFNIIEEFFEIDLEKSLGSFREALNNEKTIEFIDKFTLTNARTAKLVKLPQSLSHFTFSEADYTLQKAMKDDLAICLFCGKTCHIQKSVALHGYVQGECTNHSRNECEVLSTYGVFLLMRSNAVYLSYGQRGCFYPAPYLHKHGEPDEDFKFNNPVYLHAKRYNHLINDVILGNMIPHIVFRLTDGNSDLGGWETM